MATRAKPVTFPSDPQEAGDPYFYGWRMVPRWHADGGQTWEKVPLTEWDVLHPEEDDFIVHNDAHDRDIHYLKAVFEDRVAGRAGVQVLCDHRVEWGDPPGVVHGPDVAVFENLTGPWDSNRGTFPVREMGARPLVIVEVTSPSPRYIDLDAKVLQYHRAGVPLYVICDRREAEGRAGVNMIGYRSTPDGSLRLPEDPRGVWVEAVGLWVRGDKDRVVCIDDHGVIIPDHRGQRDAERARADAASADRDAERARADAAEQKLKDLEAELKRLRGDARG